MKTKAIYKADGTKFDSTKKITREEAEREASFLKKWSKRNQGLVRQWGTGTSFWSQGKLMTKLEPAMIEALVEFGFATVASRGPIGFSEKQDPVKYVLGVTKGETVEGVNAIRMVY